MHVKRPPSNIMENLPAMLNHLKFDVTFPTTGRTFDRDITFQKGFGAISGANEQGKSMILEMIRYALFGTAALRGVASDYKSLKVELTFTVKGETYVAKRTGTTAKLFRGSEEIANGQKGVNNKVVEILGYGLKVFDTTNVANQGDLEKLGSMQPSERKQMVDSVIGLSVIDDLSKWCGQEANSIASLVSGMEDGLVEPVRPEEPAGYCGSDRLEPDLAALRAKRDELNQIKGRLALPRVAKPAEPVAPSDASSQELETLVEQARAYEAAQAELARLPSPPPPFEEPDFEAWEKREQILRNYQTSMTAEQIERAVADMELLKRFERLDHLEKQWKDLVDVGEHTCPACSHSWPIEGDRLEKVREQMTQLQAELAGGVRPAKPDMASVEVARRQLQAWDKVKDEWERVKDAAPPQFTRQQVAQWKAAQQAQARRAELEAIKPGVGGSKELNQLWRARLAYEHELASYQERLNAWQESGTNRVIDEERAAELAAVPHDLQALEQCYQEAKIFEDRMATYERAVQVYEQRRYQVDREKEKAEGYRKGREALTILRRLVKQHLIPSLNKVASHYLTKMTGGQRNVVEVNEDFEITIDGQPLNTLSGSGKAVANLALRFGLGQVLTNNVFSIFLADEIDASMDADRANNTALTLEYLAERISQILLVTHKYPQADYYIELEANENQSNH